MIIYFIIISYYFFLLKIETIVHVALHYPTHNHTHANVLGLIVGGAIVHHLFGPPRIHHSKREPGRGGTQVHPVGTDHSAAHS